MATDTVVDTNSAPAPIDEETAKALSEPNAPREVEVEEKDVVDILQPKAKVVKWKIGPENMQREYVQRELSFIGKMQWFSLVGDVVDKALAGEDGLRLGHLLSAPGGRSLSIEDFRDADTFVQAIGKLLRVAPDFLIHSYLIWLNVPDYEHDLAAELMTLPAEEGGLSDKQGIEIIETFIDQNYEALDRFFREEVAKLGRRLQAHNKKSAEGRK